MTVSQHFSAGAMSAEPVRAFADSTDARRDQDAVCAVEAIRPNSGMRLRTADMEIQGAHSGTVSRI